MPKKRAQSAESKYIKRINEQVKNVFEFTSKTGNQSLLYAWERAIRDSGLSYKRSKKGHLIVANTKKNQADATKLIKSIEKWNAKTVRDYRRMIRAELKKEGKKATEEAITKRIQQHTEAQNLEAMFDVLYKAGYRSDVLNVMNQGKDNFYNAVDEITELYNLIDRGPDTFDPDIDDYLF